MSAHRHHQPLTPYIRGPPVLPLFAPTFPNLPFCLCNRIMGDMLQNPGAGCSLPFLPSNWWQVRPLHECHLLALPCPLIYPSIYLSLSLPLVTIFPFPFRVSREDFKHNRWSKTRPSVSKSNRQSSHVHITFRFPNIISGIFHRIPPGNDG